MRFFSRRATSSRGRWRLLAPCDKSSKEGLGKLCRMHIRLAGCGPPLLYLYHARWQGSWVLTGRAVTRFRFSRALAGIMGVDREGGYAIPFLTRAGGGGITRVKGDRVCLLASDLAIIPCSARAGNMSSLFTSELRLTTLSPAGSEYQDGNCRNGSGSHTRRICPELYAGDGLSWRQVAYAPSLSRTVRRGRIELEAGHIRAGSVT